MQEHDEPLPRGNAVDLQHVLRPDGRDPVPVEDHVEVEDQREHETGGQLDPQVAAGERRAAKPAPAPAAEPADDRQVVGQVQRTETGKATRVRPEKALFERQPADDDVQKTPHVDSEEERERYPDDFGDRGLHAARIASAAISGDNAPTGTTTSAQAR